MVNRTRGNAVFIRTVGNRAFSEGHRAGFAYGASVSAAKSRSTAAHLSSQRAARLLVLDRLLTPE